VSWGTSCPKRPVMSQAAAEGERGSWSVGQWVTCMPHATTALLSRTEFRASLEGELISPQIGGPTQGGQRCIKSEPFQSIPWHGVQERNGRVGHANDRGETGSY
jgi:hypothetical protein